MQEIQFDDLNIGDQIKVYLKNGGQVAGKANGFIRGKPDKNDHKYYLHIKTGTKKIRCICTSNITKLAVII